MKITCRTECVADKERAIDLVKTLGVSDIQTIEKPEYVIITFILPWCATIEPLRSHLEQVINSDPRFIDLHRCYQTMQEGDKPNDEWYKPTIDFRDFFDVENKLHLLAYKHFCESGKWPEGFIPPNVKEFSAVNHQVYIESLMAHKWIEVVLSGDIG